MKLSVCVDDLEVALDVAKSSLVREVKALANASSICQIVEQLLLQPLFGVEQSWSIGSMLQKSAVARERFRLVKKVDLVVVSSEGENKMRFRNGVLSWSVPFGCWSSILSLKAMAVQFEEAIPLLFACDSLFVPRALTIIGKLDLGLDVRVRWDKIMSFSSFLRLADDSEREALLVGRVTDLVRANLK